MHWIRRLHLYCGLFMCPWVLLYGITAFLFNHPGAFPDRQVISFDDVEIQGTALQNFPKPEQLARKIVAALEEKARETNEGGPSFRLVAPDQAAYSDDSVFARVSAGGQEYGVRVDVARGTGRVSARGDVAPSAAPFAQSGLKVEGSPADVVRDSLPAVLKRLGLTVGDVTVTFSPELTFLMEAEGKLWRVTCDTQTGGITGRPAEEAESDLTTRSFLLRLHLAHGFPASPNARWFWALLVDVMFIAMCFWAISGLLMFWQIKAVRAWGIAVLLVSALVATVLVFAMHSELAR